MSGSLRRLALFSGLLILAGCTSQPQESVLRLATTTSTRDSGLLDQLVPRFEKQQACRVDIVAVGTGAALKLGERGDADVLLVHAPEAEREFMREGHGVRRESFMYNYFTILGPRNDPARIRSVDAEEALRRIAAERHGFVSRGDESGTHKKEQQLWRLAGLQPGWKGYLESGQGMGATIILADEMQSYVLSDHGTYLNFREKIDLEPLVDQAPSLRNDYSVILVDARKHQRINEALARSFLEYLISAETAWRIDRYRLEGQPLFHATRSTSD